MPKVSATCRCGKVFEFYPSAQSGQACSLACSSRYFPRKPRLGTETPCAVCGKPVYADRGQRAKGQGVYCSRSCQSAARTKTPVVKPCANCGKEMALKPSYARVQFCSRTCMGEAKTKRPGERLYNGKPIRYDKRGYVLVWEPEHPNKSFKGWQYEHRLVAEKQLGRYLRPDEHVHHRNHVKDDNRDENLEVMDGNDHARISGQDYRDDMQAKLDRLAEYERRFGPI